MMTEKVEFLTFNDGKALINGKTMRFGNRTIGINRHYAARTASVRIDKLIHIPYTENITADTKVYIKNDVFRVEQAQPTKSTHPPCTILTLRKYGVRKDD